MEWVFALIATSLAVSYAVLFQRGIERRQRWALALARAIGGLDARNDEHVLLVRQKVALPDAVVDDASAAGAADRLAA